MLLVTWNVNSLRARLPRVLEFLAAHQPDIVCLQETKCSPDQFPLEEIAAAGYSVAQHSGGQWAGVALLARDELELREVQIGLPGEPAPEEARWIEASVVIGDDDLRVISTYVPNGRTLDSPEFPRKLVFLEAAARRARDLSAGGLFIAGDMNIAPADVDVYDPALFADSTHVTNEERSRLAAIEAAGQLVDSYRWLHPEGTGFTWWDYRAGNFHKGLGLRIDLGLISQQLAPRLTACGIDRNFRKGAKPSDHAPLLVQLDTKH